MIAVPPDLTSLVNTFYVVRTEPGDLEEILPAYSAQMFVYVEGRALLRPEDGQVYHSSDVTFTAPLLQATPITIDGPAVIVGASLTPVGWHCLADLPADEVNNCAVPTPQVLSIKEEAEISQLARSCHRGEAEPADICTAIGNLLRAHHASINPHHEKFVQDVTEWLSASLNPELDTLYAKLAMSDRTAQRLCRRYFGVSPSRLIKRYRAIRAAMLLTNPKLPDALREEVMSSYFDQAHLIHDIRRFTGRTPGGLKHESFVQDTLDPGAHGATAKILK